MEAQVSDYPKDESIIEKFAQMATRDDPGAIVMDFFAGSGTTAHSVMSLNSSSDSQRRYILVQLPEQLDVEKKAQTAAVNFCESHRVPCNVSELTKERRNYSPPGA